MRRAFSLVELMIVVAIIGILAMIAVPTLQNAIYKSRQAEARVNLRGIGDTEVAYYSTNGRWVAALANPGTSSGNLGKHPRAWVEGRSDWMTLGWRPDGQVRCSYDVRTAGSDSEGDATYAYASASCDVDDDNSVDTLRYYPPTASTSGRMYDVYSDRW